MGFFSELLYFVFVIFPLIATRQLKTNCYIYLLAVIHQSDITEVEDLYLWDMDVKEREPPCMNFYMSWDSGTNKTDMIETNTSPSIWVMLKQVRKIRLDSWLKQLFWSPVVKKFRNCSMLFYGDGTELELNYINIPV